MTTTLELPRRDAIPGAETWDLSVYFATNDDWATALLAARAAVEDAALHRGRLGDSLAGLRTALDDLTSAGVQLEKVMIYAFLRRDEDTGDSERGARYERAVALAIASGEALAFVQPELLEIEPAKLDDWIASDELVDYRLMLEESVRHRPHTRSTEVEEILAQVRDIDRTASDAFDKLTNADLDYGVSDDDQGNQVKLSLGRYQLLQESKNRDVRQRAFETYTAAFQSHINTLASLHAGSVRADAFSARVREHNSSLEAALFGNQIPLAVYESLIASVRNARPVIERYLALRREMLGLDELRAWDLGVALSPAPERMFTIPEAVETVRQGVAPLGARYQEDMQRLFDQRMVDWHETEGKRSGAYSAGAWRQRPVILMNWNGTTEHVFTLAHEAGHAMHTWYANLNQPYQTAQYPIFSAEIASTVNEVLLTWQLLDETPAGAPAERFALLNRFADAIWGTLLRQTMFAEFEMRTHAAVESGLPLTAESLTALFTELQEVYVPGVTIDEQISSHWSRIPHFYHAFYVYQYATGISAAIAMAHLIRQQGQPAADRFLEFLASGGMDYPLPLLHKAGVDLTTSQPVEDALTEFDRTVSQMRIIWESGALSQ